MLSNLTTPSPDTLKVQREIRETNRAARSEELERLNALLDDYTNERKIRDLLPEDVETAKTFLKARIAKIQSSPSMTEEQVLALKNDKASQDFEHLHDSRKIRAQFFKEYTELKVKYTAAIEELKTKKIAVPPAIPAGVAICDTALKWLKKNKYVTPDTYADKRAELNAQYEAKSDGNSFGDVDTLVQTSEIKELKERNSFSIRALFADVLKRVSGNFVIFLLITGMILGSSLATNLNLYKNWAFRIFYALYGAIFFLVVIPYVLIYRWGMNGQRPKFYSLIPLFPYHWNNRLAQIFLGWMSYRPDDAILALREWEKESSGN